MVASPNGESIGVKGEPDLAITSEDPDFVEALSRGLAVIRSFGPGASAPTLAEVAERTQLSRGTARRLLLTLESLGYVESEQRRFRLTPKVLSLGYSYLSSLPVWEAAQPIMRRVVEQLDQSCALGVLEGLEVVYIARTPPSHLAYLPVTQGTRLPAHVNAMGIVLLAQFSEDELDTYLQAARFEPITKHTLTKSAEVRRAIARARSDGYAISDRQIHAGIRAIAVPVLTGGGRAKFAINASAEESRASRSELIGHFLPVLRWAAKELAMIP